MMRSLAAERAEARCAARWSERLENEAAAPEEDNYPLPEIAGIRDNAELLICDDCGGSWHIFVEVKLGPFESKEAAQRWIDAQEKVPNPNAKRIAPPADDLSIPDYLKRS